MNRKTEDNTVFILNKAIKEFRIKVPEKTIKDFLYAHPYYPTLKSICDALKKWKIEHYPLMLEISEIKEIKMPFIAHFNESGGQLAFVKQISNDKVDYCIQRGKYQVIDFDKFAMKFSGAVILIEPNQNILSPDYKQQKQNTFVENMILPFVVLSVLLISFHGFFVNSSDGFQRELIFIGLILITILGIVASVFLVLHEFKIHTSIGDKLCGFSSKTDCETVLSSNASRFFGDINWADAGLIYFIGSFIFLSGSGSLQALSYLALVSAISLVYPVFSVYYQGIRLKKWCPFCLLVQLVLFGNFIAILPVFDSLTLSGYDFLRLAASFVLPAIIWILYRFWVEKANWGEQQYHSFLTLKRNPKLFTYLLASDGKSDFQETENGIILGSSKAQITITVFLSLYCNSCTNAFIKLKALLDNCSEVKINVIFSVYNDEESLKLINYLYFLYNNKGQGAATEFLYNWYSTDKKLRKSLYEKDIPEGFDIAEETGKTNKSLFEKFKVAGTPTIYVNGYKFPNQYEYSDMEYYIDEIKNLTRENKRQEACANCH